MTERVIKARITRTGMRAVFAAHNNGLDLKLTDVAIGRAQNTGYVPTGAETALRTEFARVPIGGGDYLGDFEILVQGLFDGASQGWVHEIGIFDAEGQLFAVWSELNAPLAYKTNGVGLVIALTLAVSEIPPNSLTVVAGGANVNITVADPFAMFAAEMIRLQRRAVQSEIARLTPTLNSTWAP